MYFIKVCHITRMWVMQVSEVTTPGNTRTRTYKFDVLKLTYLVVIKFQRSITSMINKCFDVC